MAEKIQLAKASDFTLTKTGNQIILTRPDGTTDSVTDADTNTNTAHSHAAGNGLDITGSGGTSGTTTYSAKAGSGITVNSTGINVNTSYTTSGKNYKVQVDSTSGGLYVNVPWTDTDTNTDTKVTSVGNHYTPVANNNSALSADASSTTSATWGTTSLVTGVNLQRDAAGHVTGVTVDSIRMPANPDTNTNTWRKVQLDGTDKLTTGTSTNPLNIKAGDNMTITESNGTFTFSATDTNTDTHYTKYLQIKGNGTEAVKFTQNTDKSLNLKPGTNVSISAASGEITISATDTTYSAATTSAAGLMSAADKTKLDGIATGANKYSLPNATTSTLGGVKIGTGLSVSSGTVSLGTSGATAGSYGPNTTYSGTNCPIPYVTVDKYGRVTSIKAGGFTPYNYIIDDKNCEIISRIPVTGSSMKFVTSSALEEYLDEYSYGILRVYWCDDTLVMGENFISEFIFNIYDLRSSQESSQGVVFHVPNGGSYDCWVRLFVNAADTTEIGYQLLGDGWSSVYDADNTNYSCSIQVSGLRAGCQ